MYVRETKIISKFQIKEISDNGEFNREQKF